MLGAMKVSSVVHHSLEERFSEVSFGFNSVPKLILSRNGFPVINDDFLEDGVVGVAADNS